MAETLRPVPRHVAIILDGNGRWATGRGLPRTVGHAAGEPALFDVVHGAIALGIEWLTVYVFSTENWSRPEEEVAFLMHFNEDLLLRRRDELNGMGVRVIFMGDRDDPRVSERRGSGTLLKAVLLDLPVQRLAPDPERLGSLALVPSAQFKGSRKYPFFYLPRELLDGKLVVYPLRSRGKRKQFIDMDDRVLGGR